MKAEFGLCRDCKHWKILDAFKESLAEFPRDKHPGDGWVDGECEELKRGVEIYLKTGWDGGYVDKIETDANFGCRLFEPINLLTKPKSGL